MWKIESVQDILSCNLGKSHFQSDKLLILKQLAMSELRSAWMLVWPDFAMGFAPLLHGGRVRLTLQIYI